jgi:hypothetical protein
MGSKATDLVRQPLRKRATDHLNLFKFQPYKFLRRISFQAKTDGAQIDRNSG